MNNCYTFSKNRIDCIYVFLYASVHRIYQFLSKKHKKEGKNKFSFFVFFFGQKLIYSMLWCIQKDINAVYFIFWKYITIAHLVLVQKWNFPFLSWTSLKWITKNTCWTVVKRPLQNCPWMFRSIFFKALNL